MTLGRNFRSLALRASWPPRTRLGRITLFIIAIDIVLYLGQRLAMLLGKSGSTLGGWVSFLTFVALVLFIWLLVRALRETVLWRLRNRLIVTYIFIGVIPVILLVTLALGSFYLFAGQFAAFIVTSGINSELRGVEAANSAIAHEMAARFRGSSTESVALEGLRRADKAWADRQVSVWLDGKLILNSVPAGLAAEAPTLPTFLKTPLAQVVRDRNQLFLRAADTVLLDGKALTVISSEPLDQHLLENLAINLGEITLYTAVARGAASATTTARTDAQSAPATSAPSGEESADVDLDTSDLVPSFTVGTIPPAKRSFDKSVPFATAMVVLDWQTGKKSRPAVVSVQTRMSILYARLSASLAQYARPIEIFLLAMIITFAVIELIALLIGVGLTRTVTTSVANLYRATQHVNRGDFSHRIEVRSNDQLATLETSFNHMTASLEKLLEEQKQKQRLENELVIAQEVQAQLFPKEITQLESLEVHGFCRPARTVSGDYYDFLALNSHKLTLAVGDVSGKGISAALLMATIHSAVRAYSLETVPARHLPAVVAAGAGGTVLSAGMNGSDLSPAAMLSLLNHQLYESTPTEKYATLFLGLYDGLSRNLTYSNGGHLPPIIISPEGSIRRLESGGMVVGLFDNLSFQEGTAQLRPGDIFLAYSDGVTEPENDFGEFGEARLIDLVRENQDLSLVRISDAVAAAVYDWIGAGEQPDDITLVLARAR